MSVLWVESCRQSGKRVSEDLFPVVVPEQAVTPLMVGRLKRTKSMQPKAFEEDVQNSAGTSTGHFSFNITCRNNQHKNFQPDSPLLNYRIYYR